MSGSSIPGADAMQDSLEFIKKMWGGLGVPGMVVPTLSVEEINKQITDLKAVESWLTLNLTMLRTSIQALEVQSATITALHAMGAVGQPNTERKEASAGESAASPWAMPAGFPFSFSNPAQTAGVPPVAEPDNNEAARQASPPAAEHLSTISDAASASVGNAGAWWELLQNQFKQVVDSVAAAEKMIAPITPKAAASGVAKPAARPRTKAGTKSGTKAGSDAAPKSVGKKNGTAGKTASRSGRTKVVSK